MASRLYDKDRYASLTEYEPKIYTLARTADATIASTNVIFILYSVKHARYIREQVQLIKGKYRQHLRRVKWYCW
jgi:hypothetical protein